MSDRQTLVVKLGTSVLTSGSKQLNRSHLLEIVRECAQAIALGHRLVLVTSGAIAAGREHLGYPELPTNIATRQMLAAVGQSCLIQLWQQFFARYGLHVGQMLLTRADLEDRERFLNARDVLQALLNNHITPIINENDAVATEEIKVGDNDNLSALAAILSGADKLLLLTDQSGLFNTDPRQEPSAKLIKEVFHIDEKLRLTAGGSLSGLGTGGMMTKLQAAEIATRAGIDVVIAAGNNPSIIGQWLQGQTSGTLFHAKKETIEPRKYWIFAAPVAGVLHLDVGACGAIKQQGSSLLAKGVLAVQGNFSRGEKLRLCDEQGRMVAQGASRYNSDALRAIAGHHSQQINDILGYEYGAAVVHRDDMIVSE